MFASSSVAWLEGQAPAELPRPIAVDAGVWRRFSRLARLSALALAPVLASGPSVDTNEIPLFFGTGLGEYSSTVQFLRSLALRGPDGASPLAFQNSVHNAAAGNLSIAFGLRGPSETLCAGDLTTLRTFERAIACVAASGLPALVVLADDVGADAAAGWRHGGVHAPLGEGAAAFLIGPRPTARGTESLFPGLAPLTIELADVSRSAHAHLTFRPILDLRRSMDADPFGAFCTVEAQILAQAFRHRFRLDLGFPGAPGAALLVRLPR